MTGSALVIPWRVSAGRPGVYSLIFLANLPMQGIRARLTGPAATQGAIFAELPPAAAAGRGSQGAVSRRLASIALVSVAGPSACSGSSTGHRKVLNVGLLLGSGGIGDRSFNDSAYAGLLESQKKHNIRFETVSFSDAASNLAALRTLANNG